MESPNVPTSQPVQLHTDGLGIWDCSFVTILSRYNQTELAKPSLRIVYPEFILCKIEKSTFSLHLLSSPGFIYTANSSE